MAMRKPRLTSPSRLTAGTRQSWKITSMVEDARIPSVFSRVPSEQPGRVFSTTKALMPRVFFSGSVEAYTTNASAAPPLVTKILVPLRIQSSPSRTAVVRVAPASEPACGSVRQ